MWFNLQENMHVGLGQAFVVGDVSYPANWLHLASDDEISGLGFVPVNIVGARGDERYYDNAETLVGDTLTIVATPKDLNSLKAEMILQVKASANQLLSISDWKIIRESEGATPCDQATKTYRAAIRAASNAHEETVLAVTTLEEFAEIALSWPESINEILGGG